MRLLLIFTIFLFNCNHRVANNTHISARLSKWTNKEIIKPISENSPIIEDLVSHKSRNSNRFWDSIANKGTPMIEVSSDTSCFILTFLLRDSREDIQVGIDMINLGSDTCYGDLQLRHIKNSDVWYRSYKIPKNLAFSYRYIIKSKSETKITTDFFNHNRIPIGIIKDNSYNSFDYFLDSTKVWFYDRMNVPKGTIAEFDVKSKILNNSRSVKVYKPYDYDKSKEYPVILFFDQSIYIDRISLPTILDNLIFAKKILPCIAILVDNKPEERRNKELPLYKPFADFVAQELMPWAHQKYNITNDPNKTIVAGVSYGGLAASFIAFNYSNRFGNVLSQSGSYWRGLQNNDGHPKWLINKYNDSPKLPIRFYLDCGLQEIYTGDFGNFIGCHREMRDVLQSKGYEMYYQEFQSGHDWSGWRKTLPDGLIVLFEKMKK